MDGERLKLLRKSEKLNQYELSKIVGVQKSAISMYETNRADPTDKVKIKISNHFNVSLDYLMGVIDEPVPPYNEKLFLRLPACIKEEEKIILDKFMDFLSKDKNI